MSRNVQVGARLSFFLLYLVPFPRRNRSLIVDNSFDWESNRIFSVSNPPPLLVREGKIQIVEPSRDKRLEACAQGGA